MIPAAHQGRTSRFGTALCGCNGLVFRIPEKARGKDLLGLRSSGSTAPHVVFQDNYCAISVA
jgi:hypothetical protein